MAELETLLQQEIPSGRKALLDSKANLENVAGYCQQMYIDSDNKRTALDETKNFTTQSLASVAYQINTLASNMLHMLDIQAAELATMESSINNISMTIDIHKEKVARREIGLLTTNKVIARNHQILAPANPDRSVKYVRKPIDFSELDDLGHGVKLSNQPQNNLTSTRRISKTPSPSVDGRKRDSLKSVTSSTGYGTIRAVRTPTVPPEYSTTKRLPTMFRSRTNSNSSSGSGSMSSSGGYHPGAGPTMQHVPPPPSQGPPPPPTAPGIPAPPSAPMDVPPPPPAEGAPPPPPPTVVPPPPTQMSPAYSTPAVARVPSVPGFAGYASAAVYDPPPPPPPIYPAAPSGTAFPYQSRKQVTSMPPPDDSMMMPPPPEDNMMPPPPDDSMMMPPPPDDLPSPYNHNDSSSTIGSNYGSDPSWAPKEYIQRVIAIYDYSAENEDELSLREDEIVYVVRQNDDGWYEGVLNGVTGLFPGNYVETISA